ncbi:MAG: RNA polymerase sigma factor, partial [Planctomycetota bacterium]
QAPGPQRAARSTSPRLASDFGALFAESHRTLWLVAYGVVQDATLADDVVQEAAVIGLSKLSAYRPGTNFSAWMGRIVRYVALNQARAARRRRTAPLESAADAPGASEPALVGARLGDQAELTADQELFDDAVMAALREVPETARLCLLLKTVEGFEYAEISRLLRIPEGTAMSHVHRARRLLREKLSPPIAEAAGRKGAVA